MAVVVAVRELRKWGVEHEDARVSYVTVQVDRETVTELDAALAKLEEKP